MMNHQTDTKWNELDVLSLFVRIKEHSTFVPTLNLFSKRLTEPCCPVLFKADKVNQLCLKQDWPVTARSCVPGFMLAPAGLRFWRNIASELRCIYLFSQIASLSVRVSGIHTFVLLQQCLSLSTTISTFSFNLYMNSALYTKLSVNGALYSFQELTWVLIYVKISSNKAFNFLKYTCFFIFSLLGRNFST